MVVYLDGDNVGNMIELYLLDGKLEEAAAASERIKEAMEWLRSRFEQMEGVSVRLFGGDDLIATLPGGTDGIEVLSPILSEFRTRSGVTISAGIGASIQGALKGLRRAKLTGKDRIIESAED